MYRNLIVEPLGTMVRYDPREYLMKNFMNAKAEEEVYRLTFGSEEWRDVMLGNLSRGTANRLILEKSRAQHRAFEVQAVLDDWINILYTQESTVRIIRKLKERGFRIYYLSNMASDVQELLQERHFWRLFDGGFASCDIHRAMPDGECLTALLRNYYLMENETIYLARGKQNTQEAYDRGIASIEFMGASRLQNTLEASELL